MSEALVQLHDRAAEHGLRPSRLNARGFRSDCPLCGGHGAAAIAEGHSVSAVAICHRCNATLEIIRALGGNGGHIDIAEQRRREWAAAAQREEELRALRELADRVVPFEPGEEPPGLHWRADRLPDVGHLDGFVAFVGRDDAGEVFSLRHYAPPGHPARPAMMRRGEPKSRLHRGSIPSLEPRPKDVPRAWFMPEVLFLVEGAPCAATLNGIGAAAISFPSAAGLRDFEARRILARANGRRILVLADADPVGRAGAVRSAERLREAGLDAVPLDLFPGWSDGRDVADELREHNPAGAAEWLINATKDWRP